MKNLKRRVQAFTLMELLLVISLVGMIFGFSVPFYKDYQYRHNLQSSLMLTKRAVYSAQSFAQGVKQDSEWGVKLLPSRAVIFKGASYTNRDTLEDVELIFPVNVYISGTVDEIIFEKVSGNTLNTGTIQLQISNEVRTIQINEKGIME